MGSWVLARLRSRSVGLGVLGLASQHFAFVMVVPAALAVASRGRSSATTWLSALVLGAVFDLLRMRGLQRLRAAVRASTMQATTTGALDKATPVPEAEIQRIFWAAYLGETAISWHLPHLVASALAAVAIVAIASLRFGVALLGPVSLAALVVVATRVVARRHVAALQRPMVEARGVVASWVAAALRDRGELNAPAARAMLLDHVAAASAAWSAAEEARERVSMRHRAVAIGLVFGAWVAMQNGTLVASLGLRPLVEAMARPQSLYDLLLVATAVPAALAFARHVGGFVYCVEEIGALERPRRPEVLREHVALAGAPRKLTLAALEFRYGDAVALALPELTFDLHGPLAITGPNGAGKSTLAALLAGALEPSAGAIRFDDTDVRNMHPAAIAFVPQEPVLIASLSVRENMRLVAPEASDEVLGRALDAVELAAPLDAPVGSLSRGEQRRIAVARALAKDPLVLVVDEPDAWIDTAGRLCLARVLRAEAHVRAVIMVSHRDEVIAVAANELVLSATGGVEALVSHANEARDGRAALPA